MKTRKLNNGNASAGWNPNKNLIHFRKVNFYASYLDSRAKKSVRGINACPASSPQSQCATRCRTGTESHRGRYCDCETRARLAPASSKNQDGEISILSRRPDSSTGTDP